MNDVTSFGLIVLTVAVAGLLAVLSNRLSERLRVPAPAMFLLCAAAASDVVPALGTLSTTTVQRVVTVALVVLLFDGGMHIGWQRFRSAAGAVVWVGVAGTFVTAGALAVLAHLLFGLAWAQSLLIGAALAPTDPAVVFSVLGRREVAGRSGTILEGESGANDPVGIALMTALLAAAGTGGWAAVGIGVRQFVLQMAVGAAVGLAGGLALNAFARRIRLPTEGLYPLLALAGAFVIYGVATVAHGSGFLAVFIAGIMLGDVRAPYKAEIERFHTSMASLGEIVAFTVLGLSVSLRSLSVGHAWQLGLAIAVLLALVVRPLLVGLLLWPVRLSRGERVFVVWAGLKGAVPILLATFVLAAGVPDATRTYNIVFVVVAFSVIVQGGSVAYVATRLGVPIRLRAAAPWTFAVRLRHEPHGQRHYVVAAGAPADGVAVEDLDLGTHTWIGMLVREGKLIRVRPDTVLRPGDEVVALNERGHPTDVGSLFAAPGT